MKKIILTAALLSVMSTPAFAAPGNTAQADGAATAEVVAPITITHTANAVLNFGTFTAGTTGGTVTVARGGAGTAGGDVVLMPGSVESADSFDVTGDPARRFSITAGGSTVSLDGLGVTTMAFTTDARANHTLDATGNAQFNVGGVLTVGANQAAGVYTGTYTVTVAYN